MNLEVAKEMDRKCVLNWLNEVYITPSLSYSEYTDEEIRTLAHDAIALLKTQPEIVRCKDCRYYEPTPDKDEPDRGWCNGRCSDLPAVDGCWFCADGVAKDINVPDKERR